MEEEDGEALVALAVRRQRRARARWRHALLQVRAARAFSDAGSRGRGRRRRRQLKAAALAVLAAVVIARAPAAARAPAGARAGGSAARRRWHTALTKLRAAHRLSSCAGSRAKAGRKRPVAAQGLKRCNVCVLVTRATSEPEPPRSGEEGVRDLVDNFVEYVNANRFWTAARAEAGFAGGGPFASVRSVSMTDDLCRGGGATEPGRGCFDDATDSEEEEDDEDEDEDEDEEDYDAENLRDLLSEDEAKTFDERWHELLNDVKAESDANTEAHEAEGPNTCAEDFEPLRVVGTGGSGQVYLVQHRETRKRFAMKVLNKAEVISSERITRVQTEREILTKAHQSPFLTRLEFAFHSQDMLFFVMEFCTGGNLHELMLREHEIRCETMSRDQYVQAMGAAAEGLGLCGALSAARYFDPPSAGSAGGGTGRRGKRGGRPASSLCDFALHERQVQFIVAEIIEGLLFLHRMGVVFRDLKPQNVLLNVDGHIRIGDFGIAKIGQSRTDSSLVHLRSTSFVGTLEYMAPEVVSGEPQSSAIDAWGLGALMYELLYGLPPFLPCGKDPDNRQLFRQILCPARALAFPSAPARSPEARALVAKLLERDAGRRLTLETAKHHAFFADTNWETLHKSSGFHKLSPRIHLHREVGRPTSLELPPGSITTPTNIFLASPLQERPARIELTRSVSSSARLASRLSSGASSIGVGGGSGSGSNGVAGGASGHGGAGAGAEGESEGARSRRGHRKSLPLGRAAKLSRATSDTPAQASTHTPLRRLLGAVGPFWRHGKSRRAHEATEGCLHKPACFTRTIDSTLRLKGFHSGLTVTLPGQAEMDSGASTGTGSEASGSASPTCDSFVGFAWKSEP